MTLDPWALTFFRSSRLAGMTSFRVSFKSGSDEEEYDLTVGRTIAGVARGYLQSKLVKPRRNIGHIFLCLYI